MIAGLMTANDVSWIGGTLLLQVHTWQCKRDSLKQQAVIDIRTASSNMTMQIYTTTNNCSKKLR